MHVCLLKLIVVYYIISNDQYDLVLSSLKLRTYFFPLHQGPQLSIPMSMTSSAGVNGRS